MVRLPSEFDPIDYLVTRKFPQLTMGNALTWALKGEPPPQELSSDEISALKAEREEYRATLANMTAPEIKRLERTELAKERSEKAAHAEKAELLHFFHQPNAEADFDHWSRCAHWTLDEAIALTFGKAPEVVNWKALEHLQATPAPFLKVSPFVLNYGRLRELTKRAILWKKLFDPVFPPIYIGWAKSNEIAFPSVLADKVAARSGAFFDWKRAYDDLKQSCDKQTAQYQEYVDDWKKIVALRNETIEGFIARTESLDAQLNQARAQVAEIAKPAPPAKSDSTRERHGMLKVIYAMAFGGYGIDPAKTRTTLVADVTGDLDKQGLVLSDDTVRRYLNAGNCSRRRLTGRWIWPGLWFFLLRRGWEYESTYG